MSCQYNIPVQKQEGAIYMNLLSKPHQTTLSKVSTTHLDTWFAKIHGKMTCILAVMFNQLLQCLEQNLMAEVKSTSAQLSDAIVSDCISIPNCNTQTHTCTINIMIQHTVFVKLSISSVYIHLCVTVFSWGI
jgi:hypothetical protein